MKNREIKFRLWNGARMEDNREALRQLYNASCASIFINQHSIKMQYTGLVDKNGKEIYVGDIVNFITTRYGATGAIEYEQQACQYWIKWHQPSTVSRYRELTATGGGDYYSADYVTVIGNIYENPDLLTVVNAL